MKRVTVIVVKVFFLISYVAMLAMNYFANQFLLNGTSTGGVTAELNFVFEPAGFTFSIWGLIYSLQLVGVLFFSGFLQRKKKMFVQQDFLGILFSSSILCLFNMAWIYFWHYKYWIWSAIVLMGMLFILIWINRQFDQVRKNGFFFSVVKAGYQIYLAWVSIAFVLNMAVSLYQKHWISKDLSDVTVAIGVLVVSGLIGIGFLLWFNSFSMGVVYLWAYTGILVKHFQQDGWNGLTDSVLFALCMNMVVITVGICFVIYRKQRNKVEEEWEDADECN